MLITKTSPRTGTENTMELDVTPDQLNAWQNGALIQSVMPHLSIPEREFLISGYTEEDWEIMFGHIKEEEEDL